MTIKDERELGPAIPRQGPTARQAPGPGPEGRRHAQAVHHRTHMMYLRRADHEHSYHGREVQTLLYSTLSKYSEKRWRGVLDG